MDRQKIIYNLMRDNHIMGEIVDEKENMIAVEITWGDWKHDHLRFDLLVKEMFNVLLINKKVTEDNGSDCYSAIHYIWITR